MTEQQFRAQLAQRAFSAPVRVQRDPNTRLAHHAHPFEAMALIVAGDITITTATGAVTYTAGEVFHLPANEAHEEAFGPQGVVYLAGRKAP